MTGAGTNVRTVASVIAAGVAMLVAIGLITTFVPPVLWPDRPVPASLAAFVPAARQQLWSEAIDGLRLPLHLSFVEARCSPNGSVALIFADHRPPYTETRFAYALRGSMPTATDDTWGGGAGVAGSALDGSEFVHQMGLDTGSCEGR